MTEICFIYSNKLVWIKISFIDRQLEVDIYVYLFRSLSCIIHILRMNK